MAGDRESITVFDETQLRHSRFYPMLITIPPLNGATEMERQGHLLPVTALLQSCGLWRGDQLVSTPFLVPTRLVVADRSPPAEFPLLVMKHLEAEWRALYRPFQMRRGAENQHAFLVREEEGDNEVEIGMGYPDIFGPVRALAEEWGFLDQQGSWLYVWACPWTIKADEALLRVLQFIVDLPGFNPVLLTALEEHKVIAARRKDRGLWLQMPPAPPPPPKAASPNTPMRLEGNQTRHRVAHCSRPLVVLFPTGTLQVYFRGLATPESHGKDELSRLLPPGITHRHFVILWLECLQRRSGLHICQTLWQVGPWKAEGPVLLMDPNTSALRFRTYFGHMVVEHRLLAQASPTTAFGHADLLEASPWLRDALTEFTPEDTRYLVEDTVILIRMWSEVLGLTWHGWGHLPEGPVTPYASVQPYKGSFYGWIVEAIREERWWSLMGSPAQTTAWMTQLATLERLNNLTQLWELLVDDQRMSRHCHDLQKILAKCDHYAKDLLECYWKSRPLGGEETPAPSPFLKEDESTEGEEEEYAWKALRRGADDAFPTREFQIWLREVPTDGIFRIGWPEERARLQLRVQKTAMVMAVEPWGERHPCPIDVSKLGVDPLTQLNLASMLKQMETGGSVYFRYLELRVDKLGRKGRNGDRVVTLIKDLVRLSKPDSRSSRVPRGYLQRPLEVCIDS